MNFSRTHTFLAAAIVLSLTACGGGGGSNDGTGAGTTPTPTPTVPATPAIAAGYPVTYAAGSPSALALAYVNQAITLCGYTAMAPVEDLTTAAKNHSLYIAANGFVQTHIEVPGAPGFTGASIFDRVKVAGASDARAAAASEGAGTLGVIGGRVTTALLSAPYHQAGMLSQWTEIGVGTSSEQLNMSGDDVGLVLNYGGEQLNTVAANDIRTFPCEGTTGLVGKGGPETPDPFPGLNGDFGPGLNFETNKGGKIVVDSISLRSVATGQMVDLMEVKGNQLDSQPWRSVYASRGALADNTSYHVEATGKTFATTNGNDTPVAWTRNYTFTTF